MKTCGDLARAGHPGFVEHDLFHQHPGDAAMCYCCEEDPEPVREHGESYPRSGYDDQACRDIQIIRYKGEMTRCCCLCADQVSFENPRTYRARARADGVDVEDGGGNLAVSHAFLQARKLAGWGEGS